MIVEDRWRYAQKISIAKQILIFGSQKAPGTHQYFVIKMSWNNCLAIQLWHRLLKYHRGRRDDFEKYLLQTVSCVFFWKTKWKFRHDYEGGIWKKYKKLCFLLFEKKSSQEKTRGHTTIWKNFVTHASRKKDRQGYTAATWKKHVFVLNHGTSENAPSHRYTAGVLAFLAYCWNHVFLLF